MKKVIILSSCIAIAPQLAVGQDKGVASDLVLAKKEKVIAGEQYTFLKVNGKIGAEEIILNSQKQQISAQMLAKEKTKIKKRKIGRALDAILADKNVTDDQEIPVIFAIQEAEAIENLAPESGGFGVNEGVVTSITYGGKEITEEDVTKIQENERLRQSLFKQARKLKRQKVLANIAKRNTWLNKTDLNTKYAEEYGTVSTRIKKKDIARFLAENEDLVSAVEFEREKANSLSAAMQDTNIDPWALNYSNRQGNDVGVFMSEGECPNTSHITNYHRIASSTTNTNHDENVSAIVRGVSPDSYVYCRPNYSLATSTDINGYNGNPNVDISTHSWGYLHSSTNSATHDDFNISDRDADNQVYNNQVAVFFAAGNIAAFGGSHVVSPGKGLNVITVGNYNDSTNTINSDSCHENPETGNEKPEISAPGTSICAGGVGCWTGTSQATPHAAGFGADLSSSYTWFKQKPYLLKAALLSSATDSISGGTGKVGLGGIDFYSAYYSWRGFWWQGGNNAFDGWDDADSYPNSNSIDREVTLPANKDVRVVLSWLNRGTYTYNNRSAAHPIGTDFDITVYNPSGAWVGSSSSWDNPYESVSFNTGSTSGDYRIAIRRYANRDTSSKLHLGLMVNW